MATEAMTPKVDTNDAIEPNALPSSTSRIIVSKGTLDMAYPGLILANAARMTGIDATLFFTFWGLDVVTEKTIDAPARAARWAILPCTSPPWSGGSPAWRASPRT